MQYLALTFSAFSRFLRKHRDEVFKLNKSREFNERKKSYTVDKIIPLSNWTGSPLEDKQEKSFINCGIFFFFFKFSFQHLTFLHTSCCIFLKDQESACSTESLSWCGSVHCIWCFQHDSVTRRGNLLYYVIWRCIKIKFKLQCPKRTEQIFKKPAGFWTYG